MHEKVMLTKYFEAVDRHLERSGLMPEKGFRIRVCNQLIDLRFPTEELADIGRMSLQGVVTDDPGRPDAQFLYWYDRCDAYLPEDAGKNSSVWLSRDETGSLQTVTDTHRLIGADTVRKRFYYMQPKPKTIDCIVYGHTVAGLFSRWASASGMILLHAAAVGIDGKGVLIVGRSGSGKSTFSVSCLAAGLDFVSDDYVLLSTQGPVRAMPLYTNIAVNPDMHAQLPPCEKLKEPAYADWWNGKLHFQLAREHFCQGLDIQAVVMPRITGAQQPTIQVSPMGGAMTQMIHSSLEQLERYRDTQLIRQISARVGGLPVYEMSMSPDLAKNPAFLRSFIEKEF